MQTEQGRSNVGEEPACCVPERIPVRPLPNDASFPTIYLSPPTIHFKLIERRGRKGLG